ncbi:unnamed protein product [Penicillium glandicola]
MNREYLLMTEARELKLPPYMLNSAGQVSVHHGEVCCHVPTCQHKHVSISPTTNRQRLISHGIQFATNASGRSAQTQEDAAIIQLYNSMLEAADEDDEDNDGDEDDDNEEDNNGDDDEDYEDEEEEDDDEDDD